MNAAMSMEKCPNEELLAAFIDGRLDEMSRKQVIAHLADCAECRDVVVTANDYGNALETDTSITPNSIDTPVEVPSTTALNAPSGPLVVAFPTELRETAPGGQVVQGWFGSRALAPLLAAAAMIGVVFAVPSIRERILPKSGMEKLVEAANGLPERTTAARLSGDFAYRGHRELRSGDTPAPEVAAIIVDGVAGAVAQRAKEDPTVENLHAAGVGNVLTKRRDDAVKDLEQAAHKNPSSAEIQNDLAAAYIARGDYQLALAAAKKAWMIRQTPAAAWNIALALQYQHRDAEAVAAWNTYLELDPDSEWANEVKTKHLHNLQQTP